MYALFATTHATMDHAPITFRVGLPTTLSNAHKRHHRFDMPHYYGHVRFGIQCGSTTLEVQWWEVRAVDEHGKGLGSERHGRAIPILVHDVQTLPEREHVLHMERTRLPGYRFISRETDYVATVETAGGIAQGNGSHPMAAQSMARLNARKASLI